MLKYCLNPGKILIAPQKRFSPRGRLSMKTAKHGILILATLSLAACAETGINKTAGGALTGAAFGAGTGAIIGSSTGDAGRGTAIGAALGGVTGALIGNQMQNQDQQRNRVEEQQRRQQEELERQRREIEELRRQRGYDSGYGNYQQPTGTQPSNNQQYQDPYGSNPPANKDPYYDTPQQQQYDDKYRRY